MDIVLLAAGLSRRMGKINKLLIPYNGYSLVDCCAVNALKYLESLNETSQLIVVTGYRNKSTEKALQSCKLFIENTNAPIKLIVVYNPNYRKGQFTSTITGVKQVREGENFFVCLADMPFIRAEHYKTIASLSDNHDAVRPVVNGIPGHPVLLKSVIRKAIINANSSAKVSDILKNYDLFEFNTEDSAMIIDIDTESDAVNSLKDSAR